MPDLEKIAYDAVGPSSEIRKIARKSCKAASNEDDDDTEMEDSDDDNNIDPKNVKARDKPNATMFFLRPDELSAICKAETDQDGAEARKDIQEGCFLEGCFRQGRIPQGGSKRTEQSQIEENEEHDDPVLAALRRCIAKNGAKTLIFDSPTILKDMCT